MSQTHTPNTTKNQRTNNPFRSLLPAGAVMWILFVLCSSQAWAGPYETKKQKIIGGAVDLGHPAVGAIVASISEDKRPTFCTVTLITASTVLTAAHCIDAIKAVTEKGALAQVRFDVLRPDEVNYDIYYYDIKGTLKHPQYGTDADDRPINDIALIVLKKEVTHITPMSVSIKALDNSDIGSAFVAMGYGLKETKPAKVPTIHKRSTTLSIKEIAEKSFKVSGGERGICSGDSGGPAINYTKDNEPYIFGVVSYGYGTKHPDGGIYCDGYGVYMNFTGYLEWFYELGLLERPTQPTTPNEPKGSSGSNQQDTKGSQGNQPNKDKQPGFELPTPGGNTGNNTGNNTNRGRQCEEGDKVQQCDADGKCVMLCPNPEPQGLGCQTQSSNPPVSFVSLLLLFGLLALRRSSHRPS